MPYRVPISREKEARIALLARDVPVGTSWAFRDHRTMKEVLADEAKRPAQRRQAARREIVLWLTL